VVPVEEGLEAVVKHVENELKKKLNHIEFFDLLEKKLTPSKKKT